MRNTFLKREKINLVWIIEDKRGFSFVAFHMVE